jgi:hypothetical protein
MPSPINGRARYRGGYWVGRGRAGTGARRLRDCGGTRRGDCRRLSRCSAGAGLVLVTYRISVDREASGTPVSSFRGTLPSEPEADAQRGQDHGADRRAFLRTTSRGPEWEIFARESQFRGSVGCAAISSGSGSGFWGGCFSGLASPMRFATVSANAHQSAAILIRLRWSAALDTLLASLKHSAA